MNINQIQDYLVKHDLDGWLLADFHARNDIAVAFVGLAGVVTRRSLYFVPAQGEPVALVHAIEKAKYVHAPGRLVTYSGYKQLESLLQDLLSGSSKIAMEYSPHGRLPYIGLVDAGTIELVRECGVEIVPSADIVAHFQARLTQEQAQTHRQAAQNVIRIKNSAFEHIAIALKAGMEITEYDVCVFIRKQFEAMGMETSSGPNCSVDAHAGDPHYEPAVESSWVIKTGQLILIDLWARMKGESSAFADITWMAYAGSIEDIPAKYAEQFNVLANARDAAVNALKEKLTTGDTSGHEIDDICRGVITDAGLGEYFVHRTGHSITTSEHGAGPNIDNLETEDRRLLQPGHLFSIEPGVYFDDYGLRTEINVLITDSGPEVTTLPLQKEITALF